MAFQRAGIDAGTQARLREMAAQVREALYGPDGCPECGTKFREIEQQGMSVGLEFARLVIEQSVQTQAERVPTSALVVEGDAVQRDHAPTGVKAPAVAAVLADGGRLQLCDENPAARPDASSNVPSSAKSHGHEYKAGVLQILQSDPSNDDPCAALPEVYLRPEKIDKLARQVAKVIAELAARQQALGLPTAEDGDTAPRRIISETLTYLQNQQSRMNDPAHRKQGLPITSAHMESTVKLINRRVKGSEKYWSETGAEDLLQLTADHLSTS